ncbi:MAG: RnfABCDGE type electron transport complex subunit D, partial [Candidatus Sedimenticola sp. 6PFRAG5]
MTRKDPNLLIQSAPMLRQGMTTPQAMRDVWLSLLPVTLAGIWFFGIGALLVLASTMAGALLTEWAFT